jgi:hypothetical protein
MNRRPNKSDQCCGFRMFIPDPGSKNSNKREGRKKNLCHTFLCSHKFHKLYIILVLQVLKKKIWANFQKIIELFAQKIYTKLSKVWGWDPGSGKNLFRILDPGVKKAPDGGSATLKVTTLLSDCDDITPIVQYARIDPRKYSFAVRSVE